VDERPHMVQVIRNQHQGNTAILLALNELEFHLCRHYTEILIQKEKEFNKALEMRQTNALQCNQ